MGGLQVNSLAYRLDASRIFRHSPFMDIANSLLLAECVPVTLGVWLHSCAQHVRRCVVCSQSELRLVGKGISRVLTTRSPLADMRKRSSMAPRAHGAERRSPAR